MPEPRSDGSASRCRRALLGRPGKQPLLLLPRPAFAEGPPPDLASLRPLITLAHALTSVTSNRRRRCNTDGLAVPSGGDSTFEADPPRAIISDRNFGNQCSVPEHVLGKP